MFYKVISVVVYLVHNSRCLTPEARDLVYEWAPRVWLHSQEVFNPSTVQYHLNNIQVRNAGETVLQSPPVPQSSLLTGEETADYHMNTDMPCTNCYQPFFSGEKPAEVPSYTFVTEHNDSCSTIDITYTFFYPFNYGKDVCVGIGDVSGCLGEVLTFGNHVGDWEHVSLRIQGGRPSQIYVGVHSFGAWYSWNENTRKFYFVEGEPVIRKTVKHGKIFPVKMEVEYPPELLLEDGHPAVFSANGSHGVWADAGVHNYIHILTVHLDDVCERGLAWDTWNNLDIIETAPEDTYAGENTWVDFRGRWGNIQKLDCGFEPLVGECGLVGGPTGPRKYFNHNFPQPPQCV